MLDVESTLQLLERGGTDLAGHPQAREFGRFDIEKFSA